MSVSACRGIGERTVVAAVGGSRPRAAAAPDATLAGLDDPISERCARYERADAGSPFEDLVLSATWARPLVADDRPCASPVREAQDGLFELHRGAAWRANGVRQVTPSDDETYRGQADEPQDSFQIDIDGRG